LVIDTKQAGLFLIIAGIVIPMVFFLIFGELGDRYGSYAMERSSLERFIGSEIVFREEVPEFQFPVRGQERKEPVTEISAPFGLFLGLGLLVSFAGVMVFFSKEEKG